jgi:hypothetical protein
MSKTKFKLILKLPKIRKPVAKKANSFMKSKKKYTRKVKHKNVCE